MIAPRLALAGCAALVAGAPLRAQDRAPYLGDPIRYERDTGRDAGAALRRRIESGQLELARDPQLGLLPALLRELDVPVSTQALVFSKTSFQNARIGPGHPRAVYFGDRAYVGYVPGSNVLELSAVDPEQGAIFYTVTDDGDGTPRVERNDGECLRCHAFAWTRGWPGHLVRSVPVDAEGMPIQRLGAHVTNHDSPLSERWAGWYVTGTHGEQRHMGNVVLDAERGVPVDPDAGLNVTDLAGRFDASRYPSPHSDLVALMVLEHQTWMQDLIAWAGYEARVTLMRQVAANRAMGDADDHLSDATRRKLQDLADELLRYLLFRDEPALTAPVRGTSRFAEEFAARGPRDRRGRSLRTFDLKTRLFRYPCSYVVQSAEFAALPAAVREVVLLRLHRVLTGRFGKSAYRHLSLDDRRAILEILRDTMPDLPDEWRGD